MKKLLFILLLTPAIIKAQLSKKDSLWLPVSFFVGEWTGEGKGEPGNGRYERSYQWTMNKKFIEVKNKSTYPPSEANKSKGEVHEDVGFVSYDGIRKVFMLRQFHIEGYINTYKLESISTDGKTINFISEGIENIPIGWRARETYRIVNDNEFTETFELAEPGKDFAVYSQATFKRKY